MNPGAIKWNVVVTATIDKKKISKKELADIKNRIKEFNDSKCDMDEFKVKLKSSEDSYVVKSDFSKSIMVPYKLDFSFEGIKSLMKWFPKVIDDRDWDHHYIIDALKFKIQNTCKYIETKQRHIGWEKDVKYMRLALKLMDKLWPSEFSEEESYESEYTKYHESEFKLVPLTKEEKQKHKIDLGKKYKVSKRMEITEISENFDEFFAKNKLMRVKAIEYIKNNKGFTEPKSKYTQAMIISKLKHEKARKLLFKILEAKLETWWD